MNRFFIFLIVSFLKSQNSVQYIDGIAAVIEDHIILKSELAQMVNMAAIQNRVDPNNNPDGFVRLQNTIVQSMVDQKIMLEMQKLIPLLSKKMKLTRLLINKYRC